MDGGCPIYTYALYVNGAITDDAAINKKPYLQQHTISGLTLTGSQYDIKIRAYNDIDYVESDALKVILAATPDTPTTAPHQDYAQTTGTVIKVLYDALTVAENGGSLILGYDLWRDDGLNGDYFRLYTVDNVLATVYYDTNVMKNRVYRYKYRARNINGWGGFSFPGFMFAADVPSRPAVPTLKSVSASEIVVELYPPQDTGGSAVTEFELWRDNGSPNSDFDEVLSYDRVSLTHTLDTGDGLTPGTVYQIKFRAKNLIGYSPFSPVLRVALSTKIPAPTNLRSDLSNTGWWT